MNLDNITINMQSSIRIEGSKILYFDAFKISNEMHDGDYIFLTHEHYDHYDPEAINKIKKDESIVIAPESMKKKLLGELSIKEEQFVFLKPGMEIALDGIKVCGIHAYNKLKPFHQKHNEWLGYLVTMDQTTYYIAGDTDVTEEIKKVKCDVAIVPVGGTYTMDKKQAAEYILALAPKAVMPSHYGEVVGKPQDGKDFKDMVTEKTKEIQVELKL